MKKNGKHIFRALFLLYLAAVLFLCFGNFSDLSSAPKTILGFESDKVVHFLMFFPFPILFYLSFERPARRPWQGILLLLGILFLGSVIAVGTECIQDLIPYRGADKADFLADFLALCCSTALILPFEIKKTLDHA